MEHTPGALPEVLKVGANELELVIVRMFNKLPDGSSESYSYGVNVAKVREIIPMPALTKVPDMPDYAEAIAEVRGEVVPIVNLARWLKFFPATDLSIRPKVVILEMLGTTVGMIVHEVERIRRIKWDQIKVPPALLQAKHSGRITGVTKLEDIEDTLLLILDLENVISEIGALAPKKDVVLEELEKTGKKKLTGTVLIADDSGVARRILKDSLEGFGLHVVVSNDGKEAFGILTEFLEKIGDKPITDYVQLVITDVEMPEMDGLTFTKSIKAHPRLLPLPVIVNTSLSGPENKDKAALVGADGYLVKFDPALLFKELARFLKA
ncbi:MAG TPA: chemotaxis protein [Dissulfurispiraceae bacterium]|nr:chemotaxis protein [Dissulfurispiraceae bacterium]